ncbi:MAG: acetate/propionate family kinase [Treponema sp.]|jgi:acetate kinase|nr:acetate/propionate family kinase [Treponema sp.]
MLVLVSNAGSTSLKFKLFDMPSERPLCEARVERVGSGEGIYHYQNAERNAALREDGLAVPGYSDGIRRFLSSLLDGESGVRLDGAAIRIEDVGAIGFKTVLAKGYYAVHELSAEVLAAMEAYRPVAPVHNGAYLEVIARFKEAFPRSRMAGVFETFFHTTIPLERRLYGIPYEWYRRYGVSRLGYHSASHSYVAQTLRADDEGEKKYRRIISCHLGGSCSICAILDGKSVDNSFGFSLQAGVPHANRTGDLDPYIMLFLLDSGMSMNELRAGLEKNGGMMGLSGFSNDMRDLEEAAEGKGKTPERAERARLALDVFVTAVQRYIGQYYAELGGLDALVFTAGIGENSPRLRKRIAASAACFGVSVDDSANETAKGRGKLLISAADSAAELWIVPANEEIIVARETYKLFTKTEAA